MKYKLLKDTPGIPAGQIYKKMNGLAFYEPEIVSKSGSIISLYSRFHAYEVENNEEWFKPMDDWRDNFLMNFKETFLPSRLAKALNLNGELIYVSVIEIMNFCESEINKEIEKRLHERETD